MHGSSTGGAGGAYRWNYSTDAVGGGAGNPAGASKVTATGGNGTGKDGTCNNGTSGN